MKQVLLAVALLVLPGCVQLTTPDGMTFTRFSPFWNGQIGIVEVNTPDFSAKVSGYRSDGAEMAGAIAEGVAKGLKP